MSILRRGLTVCLFVLVLVTSLWADTITLVQMADPQLGMGTVNYQEDILTLRRTVAQINALNPIGVVICGDLVHNWTPEGARDVYGETQNFTMPWYVAAGNHDQWNSEEFRNYFGPDHRVVEFGDVALITINTNLWREPDSEACKAQWTWLEQSLRQAASEKKKIFVAGHHPLFIKTVDEADEYFNAPLSIRAAMLELFEKTGVIAYLTGHLHQNLVGVYHGVTLVSNGSSVINFTTDKPGFRIWRIDDSGFVTHEYVPVTAPEMQLHDSE